MAAHVTVLLSKHRSPRSKPQASLIALILELIAHYRDAVRDETFTKAKAKGLRDESASV
jgi:hypothetical protein